MPLLIGFRVLEFRVHPNILNILNMPLLIASKIYTKSVNLLQVT
jgi:hypothetical protein